MKPVKFSDIELGVTVKLVGNLKLPDLESNVCEAQWSSLKKSGANFFRGIVYSVTNNTIANNRCSLDVVKSDYAHYQYTVNNEPVNTPIRALYVSALLVTSDQYFVIGEMANNTATPGRLQLPGGNVDEHDLVENIDLDTKSSVLREIHEEVGLIPSTIENITKPYCLKQEGNDNFYGLIYQCNLDLDKNELLGIFNKHNSELLANGEKPELTNLHFIGCNDTEEDLHVRFKGHQFVDYLAPLMDKAKEDLIWKR